LPPSSDDFVDPPWQEDCQPPLYDDASQAPPDAQDGSSPRSRGCPVAPTSPGGYRFGRGARTR